MIEDPDMPVGRERDSAGELRTWLAHAGQSKLTKPEVRKLAESLARSRIDHAQAVREALGLPDVSAATAVLIAAIENGYRPEANLVGQLLPVLPDIRLIAPLVGRCDGDRNSMLLDAVEVGSLSWEREALALFLAVELMGADGPPPRLLTRIRLLSRESLSSAAGMTLGLAALGAKDQDTLTVARRWVTMAGLSQGRMLCKELRGLLATAPFEVLPDEEEPQVVVTSTARVAARVGRNDPCPCGSGRKYKKCCMGKNEAWLSDPSPVAGVPMTEYRARREKYLDRNQIDDMSARDLAGLDFEALPPDCIALAVQKLSTHRFWAEAERALEALERAKELPGPFSVDACRAGLLEEAIEAKAREVVLRQLPKFRDKGILEPLSVDIELLNPSAESLSRLESAASKGLRSREGNELIDLAYALLEHYPALGILVARGALNPAREFDMEYLLDDVERARDRLQLSPGDLAFELYEYLLDREVSTLINEEALHKQAEAQGKVMAEAAEQRQRLKEATAKVASLERRLGDQERLLRSAALPKQAAAVSKRVLSEHETEEMRRLREKVTELKGLIAEGQKERSGLRVQLADAARKIEQVHLADGQAAENKRAESTDDDGLEEPVSELPRRTGVLIPAFSASAHEAVRDAGPSLARQALRQTIALATDEPAAWVGIKRLRSCPDFWSARIGLHHRLLFRIDSARSRLEVVAFVPRRDLELAIKRLPR